ncbi:MAG: MEDS domain-containing protein [Betaproteobacteria bacterium]|nr:MEDS domain-containing protein [Betaproteobacteria bacterium]
MNKRDHDNELLNIKQAAKLLNVSEVSLRRWTRSGALACLRVGPKRERRFRREDLHAYLQKSATPSTMIPARTRSSRNAHIEPGGVRIDHGSHVCSLYENDVGRIKLAVPFLLEGLSAGELCFLVASKKAQDIIIERLDSARPGVRGEIAQGRFVVMDGAKSGTAMYEFFKNAFAEETRSGHRRLRVVGDMVWAVEQELGVDELIDFELRYNRFLAHQFPVASLCQYDARKFSGVAILDALKCHEDTFSYPLGRFLN